MDSFSIEISLVSGLQIDPVSRRAKMIISRLFIFMIFGIFEGLVNFDVLIYMNHNHQYGMRKDELLGMNGGRGFE